MKYRATMIAGRILGLIFFCGLCGVVPAADNLDEGFVHPPDAARPGVYWYFMDGNLDRQEMVNDLESMKSVGIGNLIFLEVNVGVPRGPVKFMSDEWLDLFTNAVHHAERLGIDISLGTGPGWCGSGGPWIKPEQAMQHLVFSSVDILGPVRFDEVLPVPAQRSTPWHTMRSPFYEDVVVYAFPKCNPVISNVNEKAFYKRDPFSSAKVNPYLPAPGIYPAVGISNVIDPGKMIDLTRHLQPDGRLIWDVPAGEWTILRMGRRPTGASTRPAPVPGMGLEHDKFDPAALDEHFRKYFDRLRAKVGRRAAQHGWTTMHLDSWEMGAQNWTPKFREEFKKRRGYDPQAYFPTFSGRIVTSLEVSGRFLWDLRLTAQELVLENYAGHLKALAHKHGFALSIEPYDMNPAGDLDLGAVADVPAGEFWSVGFGYDTAYSCIEASSVGHTMGRPIVAGEAFTARAGENWQQYPWSMKNEGDWAFCMGINRFVFHTFAHQALGAECRPGMTMGPYGVHWDRGQSWWPLVTDFHRYVTRCSYMLRQGVTVSDILYLTPEGAPLVFRPPASALNGSGALADKKGYGFDGCSPNILLSRAKVKDGRIVFPEGSSYRLLVLPRFATMTPALLEKVTQLVKDGAVVFGNAPMASPSLSGYPQSDVRVRELAGKLWGNTNSTERQVGKGWIITDTSFQSSKTQKDESLPIGIPPSLNAAGAGDELYPDYVTTAAVLERMGVAPDFQSEGPIRYTHRQTENEDIYFIANTTSNQVQTICTFRVRSGAPRLCDPVTAEIRMLPQFTRDDQTTSVPFEFEPYQSYFVRFARNGEAANSTENKGVNFPEVRPVATLDGAWDVAFDPQWGGPEKITFATLQDWTASPGRGIKYYSGIAAYQKSFDLPSELDPSKRCPREKIFLDLGEVHDLARVKLNGQDLGVVWCAPWQMDITSTVKERNNILEIDVANRWSNRMLGDQQPPDKNVRTLQWSSGLLAGKEFKAGRYTVRNGQWLGQTAPLGTRRPGPHCSPKLNALICPARCGCDMVAVNDVRRAAKCI